MKPLRRQLKTLKAWITGQRKDQSPGTRMAVPVVEVDPVFEGESCVCVSESRRVFVR